MTDTIPAVLRAAATTHPNRLAYAMDGDRLTFAELHERVRNVARSLVDFGFEPGDRVAIWGPNSLEWVVAALATTYVGGIVVPLNSRYTAHEAAPLVHRSGARWVFVEDGFLGRNQWEDLQAAADLPHVETFFTMRDHATEARISLGSLADMYVPSVLDADVDALADAVSPDDVADILFTSGTTGQPKGAMSAHRQTVGVARVWGELGGVSPEDRYLVVNPFFHSFGYKVGIVTGLLTGATLYPLATFDVDEVATLIERERITLLPGAPTIFTSLLAADAHHRHDLSSLRLAVTGAAVVPVVLIERMREELAIEQVVTAFGMTEAVVTTMCRGDETADIVATTCGRAVPGMETRIDAPPGEAGELLVRGDHVMLGYLDDPAATAEAIDADGWLHTGDVGTLDADGNLRITDRMKDMYISGGFNVYPAEVEQVLGARRRSHRGGRRRGPGRAPGRGRSGVRRGVGVQRRGARLRARAARQLQGAARGAGRRRASPQPVRQGAQDGPARGRSMRRTPEQAELATIVRSLLDKRADSAGVRAAMASAAGFDEGLWQTLCEQIGVAALAIPEEHGGAGFTLAETCVVLEELGRSLAPSPLLPTALAAAALLAEGDASGLLTRIATGEIATIATPDHVLFGAQARIVLAYADGRLVEVDETPVRVPAMDPTSQISTVDRDVDLLPDHVRDVALVLTAALQVGGMQRALDDTVAYSKQRVQFGRPIGSFQALKHRMADMLVRLELARSAMLHAVDGLVGGAEDAPERAAVAAEYCTEAFNALAGEMIQLHGGIAITWEHDAHLVFKRAHALGALWGRPHEHRARLSL